MHTIPKVYIYTQIYSSRIFCPGNRVSLPMMGKRQAIMLRVMRCDPANVDIEPL